MHRILETRGSSNRRAHAVCGAACLAVAALLPAAEARDFRVGRTEGLLDVTLAYGLSVRTEDADHGLIGIANGGEAPSVNYDDGNQNYGTGVVSNIVRATGELTVRQGRVGAYVRGSAFYDYENEDNNRDRTSLSSDQRDVVGKDTKLLDSYVTWRFRVAEIPVRVRLGDQVINWGETLFIRDGVDIINPVDLVAVFQPTSTSEDVFIPQGMVWGAASVTQNVAVEGYYQYEWERARLPVVGTYFSASDLVGADGVNAIFLGSGQVSDLGTDLDDEFGLPAGTLGFDENYNRLPGLSREQPDDGGQYGLTLRTILPGTTATKLGVHYVRYHARLPIITGITASQEAVDATSRDAVDDRAAALAPVYESIGLSEDEALAEATATSESLTLSGYANEAGFVAEYPEDIDMFGVTFNTATRRTGTLLSGELSHHLDYPFQIDVNTVANAVLSPVQYDADVGSTSLGEFGADERVRGFKRLDKTQAALGIAQFFGPRLGASQSLLSLDTAAVYVHDLPDNAELPLAGTRRPNQTSWGYRVLGRLDYNGIFGGLNLRPRFLFTHDVSGTTPGPFGTFIDERKSVTVGVASDYIRTYTLDLSYTSFFGGGRANRINDRDVVRLRLSFNY